ncbi:hypothetical protein GCM10023149_50590 [Mucilaginibacter gynuensis]|uniref:Plasmid transfer protein n=1 Tax=Mucilaginibacter gynuensis TaxID=1302236 RepID=A0ABP8HIM5_9SPHI
MKNLIVLPMLFLFSFGRAQKVVYDSRHFTAVSQNAAVRSAAESTHEQYLSNINNDLDNLNTNVAAVVLAQTIIYESLSNVNSALKNGIAVRNMSLLVADMTGYVNQAITMARGDPALLLFAGNISAELRTRAIALVRDVSGYILKEGNNVLADYNSRDQLLRRVTQQLQIMNGLAYGAWKAMYWAKQRGVLASLNPVAGFISQDRRLAEQIIINAKFLKP